MLMYRLGIFLMALGITLMVIGFGDALVEACILFN